jgi:hypothetical protein
MSNAAYRDGFQVAQTDEHTGWPLDRKPDENTLVDTLRTMSILLTRDKHDEYEVAWCAGLLAGWFARHSQVAG